MDRWQKKASARVGGRGGRRVPPAALRLAVGRGQFVLLLAAPSLRENGKRGEKGARDGHSGNSEGSDVIERVVQLLADGLVFHLLCIDFIWGVRRGEEGREHGERKWRREEERRRRMKWKTESEGWTEERGRRTG